MTLETTSAVPMQCAGCGQDIVLRSGEIMTSIDGRWHHQRCIPHPADKERETDLPLDSERELERVELAVRRVYDHIRIQPHETSVEAALKMLADEMSRMAAEARRLKQP